jgi:hypothetical protein
VVWSGGVSVLWPIGYRETVFFGTFSGTLKMTTPAKPCKQRVCGCWLYSRWEYNRASLPQPYEHHERAKPAKTAGFFVSAVSLDNME